jgi:tyrosine-protein phosphatase SIW14
MPPDSESPDRPPDLPSGRPRRRRWPWLVGLVAAAVGLFAAVHYWPGRGMLTYVGVGTHPMAFDLHGPSRLPLSVPRHDIPGIPNFAKVSDELYRGGQPTRQGFAELRRMGIKTVVNLRETGTDRLGVRGTGMRYVHLRVNPNGPTDEEVAAFLEVLQEDGNLPVFVHCKMGADRTGTLVAIYRVVHQDWPMEEAVKEFPRFGFHDVWAGLLDYLEQFDPERIEQMIGAPPSPPPESLH